MLEMTGNRQHSISGLSKLEIEALQTRSLLRSLEASASRFVPIDLRTLLLISAVILLNSIGNLSLAYGMRHAGENVGLDPLGYIRVMWNPAVAGGIVLLIFWLLMRMTLLSWADLSFVLPLTSFGYVLAAILGYVFLHETVTPSHWAGTALIFVGTMLVGSTQSKTTGCPGASR